MGNCDKLKSSRRFRRESGLALFLSNEELDRLSRSFFFSKKTFLAFFGMRVFLLFDCVLFVRCVYELLEGWKEVPGSTSMSK